MLTIKVVETTVVHFLIEFCLKRNLKRTTLNNNKQKKSFFEICKFYDNLKLC